MTTARQIIETLDLARHPEGGWFRESWRAGSPPDERAHATAIHFLLESGDRSHWHRVDATEIWFWHAGDPLLLSISAGDTGAIDHVRLGPALLNDEQVQSVIAPGDWQAAEPLPGPSGFTLVSCVVAPAFEFAGFELAPPDWRPGA